jgi:hypothetical protein
VFGDLSAVFMPDDKDNDDESILSYATAESESASTVSGSGIDFFRKFVQRKSENAVSGCRDCESLFRREVLIDRLVSDSIQSKDYAGKREQGRRDATMIFCFAHNVFLCFFDQALTLYCLLQCDYWICSTLCKKQLCIKCFGSSKA